MKHIILLFSIIGYSVMCNAQIISTVAGNGLSGDSGDGAPATMASINQPFACAFDSHGNLYFTEVGANKVRKINTSGIISTIAGGGSSLGDGGPATAAQFTDPTGIAIDASDNIYIADLTSFRIRKINSVTGIITTIAGNGSSGYGGDNGPATNSVIISNNICIDKLGNIYVLDQSNRIRKIDTVGMISTFAGNGLNGYTGDGGLATAAEINPGIGICADANNNVYFAQGNNIRKISVTGIITTIAGNGSSISSGDGGPAIAAGVTPYDLTFDKRGSLYISCYIINIVRKIDANGIIYTIAGNGIAGYSGDGMLATAAELHTPIGIAIDTCDNLYIADRDDNHIRKVAFNPSCIPAEINTVEDKERISIYPNPTYNILNINNLITPATYCLQNIIGVTMQQGTLKAGNNSISMRALPGGMYMLALTPALSAGGAGGNPPSPNGYGGRGRTTYKIIKQ